MARGVCLSEKRQTGTMGTPTIAKSMRSSSLSSPQWHLVSYTKYRCAKDGGYGHEGIMKVPANMPRKTGRPPVVDAGEGPGQDVKKGVQ